MGKKIIKKDNNMKGGKKVKYTPVQALRLCTGSTAHRGSRGIALPFHDHGTRRGWGVSVTPRPLFTPGKNPLPIVQEAGWAPGTVWTGAENHVQTGIRSPDRPARSVVAIPTTLPGPHTMNEVSAYSLHSNKDLDEFEWTITKLRGSLLVMLNAGPYLTYIFNVEAQSFL